MSQEPYLRWHPAQTDPTGTMRGDGLESLNQRTFEGIHELAIKLAIEQEGLNREVNAKVDEINALAFPEHNPFGLLQH